MADEPMEVEASSSNDAPCLTETAPNSETIMDDSSVNQGGNSIDEPGTDPNKQDDDVATSADKTFHEPDDVDNLPKEPNQNSCTSTAGKSGNESDVHDESQTQSKPSSGSSLWYVPNDSSSSQKDQQTDTAKVDAVQSISSSSDGSVEDVAKSIEIEPKPDDAEKTGNDDVGQVIETGGKMTADHDEGKEPESSSSGAAQESGNDVAVTEEEDKIVFNVKDTQNDNMVTEGDDKMVSSQEGTENDILVTEGDDKVVSIAENTKIDSMVTTVEDVVVSNTEGIQKDNMVMEGVDKVVSIAEDIHESIDLAGADDDVEEQKDDEGSDGGVQEIHDVEDVDEPEEAEDMRGGGAENVATRPEQISFPTPQEHIHHLSSRVKGLESELSVTRKKLSKAEKKLSRSRRHKESAESYNYDLRRKVKHMKKDLHRFRKHAKKSFAEVGCQTQTIAEVDHDDVIEIPSTSMGASGSMRGHDGWGMGDDHGQSLADSLKATAEAALSNSGYVLDPNSGLYYDYSTGYYYDPNNHLYYDPSTGVYYYYDQQSRTYQFHSQVQIDPTGMLPHSADRPRRGKRKKDRRQRREMGDEGDCEVIEVPDDDSPESKRPKKVRRKQKEKGTSSKAPHTATTSEEANMDDNRESGSKDADKDQDGQNDAGGDKATEKESRTPKKGSKRSKSKSSRKKSADSGKENEKEEGEKMEVGEEGANEGEAEKGKETDTDKTGMEEESRDNIDKHQEGGAPVEKEGTSKEIDDETCPDSDKNKEQTAAGSAEQEESESTQKRSEEGELQSDGEIENEEKRAETTSASKDNTNPAASATDEARQDDSPTSPTQQDEGDDEIMEVESKKKEEIEEITILDSDTDDSEMEEGELSDTSAEVTSSDESSDYESDVVAELVPVTPQDFPACIRMIVTRSDKIQLGALFIVTCTGGTIGREGSNHVVTIPELGVSKQHAEIKYNEALKQYSIRDLGSQNGTLINGKMLSKARSVSEPHPLTHKDYLTVGSTTLRVHTHPGSETCDECEPGQVQALFAQLNPELNQVTYTIVSPVDKEQMRRKELRKLKKKYNLVKDNYVQSQEDPSTSNSSYTDRAGARRKTVGSDNPYQPDDAPASVDRAISDTNVGRKMMEKMGWKEGSGLGKGEGGITEPIQVLVRNQKAGLGAGVATSMDKAHLMTQGRKNQRWQRTKARFDRIQQQEGGGASTSNNPQTQWVKGDTETMEEGKTTSENDNEEDIIEILSPESDNNSSSPSKEDPPITALSSSTAPTETPSNSVTSTTAESSATAEDSTIAEGSTTITVSDLNSESRPKIQLKLISKRGKEQLPTSSVVLDDGDDEEEEGERNGEGGKDKEVAMELNGSVDKGEEVTSAANDAKVNNTRKSKRTGNKETNHTTGNNNLDPSVEENTNSETGKNNTDLTMPESESVSGVESSERTRKSPRGKFTKSQWVKVGEGDQNKDKTDDGDKVVGQNTQGKEAGTSGEGASDGNAMSESQSDRGKRRRTRRGGKKNEDMFADL